MASVASICNMALSHIATGASINNLDDRTNEARACATFYEQVRNEVLSAAPWPFATAIDNLALITEQPNSEWRFSYRYPAACVAVRRILPDGGRTMAAGLPPVPYRIARDSSGRIILADKANAQVEYTILITDPNEYPPDFAQAVSLKLAHYIAPRLTKGDDFRLANRAFQLYQHAIATASAHAFNEEQADPAIDSEFIRGR